GLLYVYDRVGFIEAIDESGVFGIGAAFLRASAHAEVSIAERQHRLQLSQEFGMKTFFDDVPLISWEIVDWRPVGHMMEHWAVLPGASTADWSVNQFAQIVHDQICAMTPKLLGIALARNPDHKPKVPVGSGLHAREGILDDYCSRRLDTEQLSRHQKRIRSRFSRQVFGKDRVAVDPHIEEPIQPGGT